MRAGVRRAPGRQGLREGTHSRRQRHVRSLCLLVCVLSCARACVYVRVLASLRMRVLLCLSWSMCTRVLGVLLVYVQEAVCALMELRLVRPNRNHVDDLMILTPA